MIMDGTIYEMSTEILTFARCNLSVAASLQNAATPKMKHLQIGNTVVFDPLKDF